MAKGKIEPNRRWRRQGKQVRTVLRYKRNKSWRDSAGDFDGDPRSGSRRLRGDDLGEGAFSGSIDRSVTQADEGLREGFKEGELGVEAPDSLDTEEATKEADEARRERSRCSEADDSLTRSARVLGEDREELDLDLALASLAPASNQSLPVASSFFQMPLLPAITNPNFFLP